MARRTRNFSIVLEAGIAITVRYSISEYGFEKYSVVLVATIDGQDHTIRVFDNAHGRHDMHRYTQSGGKQDAQILPDAEPGQAMRDAIARIATGFKEMIDGWHR